jgi:hypothetical protein
MSFPPAISVYLIPTCGPVHSSPWSQLAGRGTDELPVEVELEDVLVDPGEPAALTARNENIAELVDVERAARGSGDLLLDRVDHLHELLVSVVREECTLP